MTTKKASQPTLETILRPGQTVAGKYCVDHLIASGGMAAVWAGSNLRTGKRVALKVILRSFSSTPGAGELFRREAMAASRVNHPNVVTVFDVVDHGAGTCIVMEFLDCEDLGAYFERQGLLSLDETMALLLPAMRGVAAANAQGVVHRDLKPKNIFLCIGPDGRVITTKILDFGISVIADNASQERSNTVQLTTHGTPAYMSPEHITGSPTIDERADVYGFGVILFEALAGQAPYVGPPGPDLLMRILGEPVPKLTRFRADMSPEMDAIIERALAKNPDDRFPTLDHFIAALEEQVPPRLPLLRSMTPMVGVPLTDSGSVPKGLADPVIRVVQRSEPSGEHDGGATRALYVLSRSTPSHAVEVKLDRPTFPMSFRPEQDRTWSRDDDTASLLHAVRGRMRVWRLLALAAGVGTISVVVSWFVIPNRHGNSFGPQWEEVTMPVAPGTVPHVAEPTPAAPILPSMLPPALGEAPPAVLPREVSEPVPDRMPARSVKAPIDGSLSPNPHPGAQARATRALSRPAARGTSGSLVTRPETARYGTVRAIPVAPADTGGSATAPAAQPTPAAPPSTVAPPPAEMVHRAGQLSADDF